MKTEHTHTTTLLAKEKGYSTYITKENGCIPCVEEREEGERAKNQREQSNFETAEPLNCDKCGLRMGYVHTFDLEGNRFYCLDRKQKGLDYFLSLCEGCGKTMDKEEKEGVVTYTCPDEPH